MPGFNSPTVLTPVGGWFDAVDQVLDSSVFDFGPRTDVPKAAPDTGIGSFNDLTVLSIARANNIAGSTDAAPTRNAHSRAWAVTQKPGDSGVMVAAWQNGAAATPGIVYSFSSDGQMWSVPAQISSRTGVYPTLLINPNTNDIVVLYLNIGTTLGPAYARVLPYAGSPGSPSWGTPTVETAYNSGNNSVNGAAVFSQAGYLHKFYDDVASGGTLFESFPPNPYDPTGAWSFRSQVTFGNHPTWPDVVSTTHFGGYFLLAAMNGGQFHVYTAPQPSGASQSTLTQQDTFFASSTEDGTNYLEQYSLAYNDASDQLCLAYVNGTSLTYKVYSWNGTSLATVAGPTVIDSLAACHSPMVQADASGYFYIVWIEDTPSSTQRSIRAVRTDAPTVLYRLTVEGAANSWKWIDGPRTTAFTNLLMFSVAETGQATDQVFLFTVPVSVFQRLAETAVGVDGANLTINVALANPEQGHGTDSAAQTVQVGTAFCKPFPARLFDGSAFDTAVYDDPCQPFPGLAERGTATEIFNSGPGTADSGTGTEGSFSIVISFTEAGAGAETFVPSQTVSDSGAGDDSSLALVENPIMPGETGSGTETLVLIVNGPDSGAALEAWDILQSLSDDGAGAEAWDLQTTTTAGGLPNDAGSGTEVLNVGILVLEVGAGLDTPAVTGVLPSDEGIGSETFTVDVLVADSGVGNDAGVSWWIQQADAGAGTESFVVTLVNGIQVRLYVNSGRVSARVEGNRPGALPVRN